MTDEMVTRAKRVRSELQKTVALLERLQRRKAVLETQIAVTRETIEALLGGDHA